MRHTETTGENYLAAKQDKLDIFWTLIEDQYEEDWRVDANGDVLLEVDEDFLQKVLGDNSTVAWYAFGAVEEHSPENKKFEWHNLPEYLLGTYTIKGIYAPDLSFVPGDYAKRTYYFVQEGF